MDTLILESLDNVSKNLIRLYEKIDKIDSRIGKLEIMMRDKSQDNVVMMYDYIKEVKLDLQQVVAEEIYNAKKEVMASMDSSEDSSSEDIQPVSYPVAPVNPPLPTVHKPTISMFPDFF